MAWQSRVKLTLMAFAVVGSMVVWNVGLGYGQAVPPSRGAVAEVGAEPEPRTSGETVVIPSISVQERYDSNVFFIPGGKLEDFVTTVSPQVKVAHKGRLVEGTIGGGATAEVYARNPGLNYVAANGMMELNLGRMISEVVRGVGLQISDTFYFTPQAPAFATAGSSQIPEAFARGVQAQRRNSFTNGGTVMGSYDVSSLLTLRSTYLDQRIRFGATTFSPDASTASAAPATFIDTTFQTVTSGPEFKLTPIDTVSVSHQYQVGGFEVSGSKSGFSTQGALVGWTRKLSPTLTSSLQGGVLVFSKSGEAQYQGSASLDWVLRDVNANLSYSRAIAPSFLTVGVPMLTQMISATVKRQITESLAVSLGGNYAINQSVPDRSLLKFESYSVTPSIEYKLSRVVTTSLSYTRSSFTQEFSGASFAFDRNMVLVRLAAEWK